MVVLNDNNLKILQKRYLQDGEDIEDLYSRVIDNICPQLRDELLELFRENKFLPNTPTLMNAGLTNMLSACFVIPVNDSLESIIHDAVWQQAKIHKMAGGVGMNFSNLRPRGDKINSTGGVTSGVLGFMEVFNTVSEIIRQGGKRDGANMGILNVDHPEIEDFITAKVGNNKFRNFNLSVGVTDEFMNAVQNHQDWHLKFDGKIYKTVNATELFNKICNAAWSCGCPGIVFLDTINKHNPLRDSMPIQTTNPCAEVPAYCGDYNDELIAESCNLGSINLSSFVEDGVFDWESFSDAVETAVIFLDSVIDKNNYPFDFIEKGTKLTRKIGLGVTGFHECLVKLGISYVSQDCLDFIEKLMMNMNARARHTSQALGVQLVNYPLAEEAEILRRNLTLTCIAPTGTIGRLMTGHPFSLGIEPPYALHQSSNILDGSLDDGIYPILIEKLKEAGCYSEEILQKIKTSKGIQHIDEIPREIRKLFFVADEISPSWHVRVQATFQKYVDLAVSKTVNLSNDVTIDEIGRIFLSAWRQQCKGITVYRDNSKDVQVFNSVKNTTEKKLKKRDKVLSSETFKMKTGCSTLYITITKDKNGNILEVFVNRSSEKGGCAKLQDGLSVAISIFMRYLQSINPEYANEAIQLLTRHLDKQVCRSCEMSKFNGHEIDANSCPAAISECIKSILKPLPLESKQDNIDIVECPECGTPMKKIGGCNNDTCPECGFGGCN